MGWAKKTLMTAAAAATALSAAAPAAASGRYGYGAGYDRYDGHYRGGYYYGSRHYRHRHHHHLSGAEAALIAAGIIGGIILIDRAIEESRYRDRYDRYDPYYDRYPDRYDRYGDGRYDRYSRPYDGDYERRYDARDDDLAGGPASGPRPAPRARSSREYNYGAAYNDCKAETRDAARDAGMVVSLPARPDRIIPIERGAAVRFEARYFASDRRGGEWRRLMVCEADAAGVRRLELR